MGETGSAIESRHAGQRSRASPSTTSITRSCSAAVMFDPDGRHRPCSKSGSRTGLPTTAALAKIICRCVNCHDPAVPAQLTRRIVPQLLLFWLPHSSVEVVVPLAYCQTILGDNYRDSGGDGNGLGKHLRGDCRGVVVIKPGWLKRDPFVALMLDWQWLKNSRTKRVTRSGCALVALGLST